jgi:hypothetical protein
MNRIPLTLVALVAVGCNGGVTSPPQPSTAIAAEKAPTVRYMVPADQPEVASSSPKWGLAAPVVEACSDPNQIVYDGQYLEAYFEWAHGRTISCGIGTYCFVTPEGEILVESGLDERYLGMRFRTADLIRFLERRLDSPKVYREFTVPGASAMRPRFVQECSQVSPWDRDTSTVISLLAKAESKEAYPHFTRLLDDPSLRVREAVLMGLSRISNVVPKAADDIARMLEVSELRGVAVTALSLAGENAVPAIVHAFDHRDSTVRNQAVVAITCMPSIDAAVRCLITALNHDYLDVRVRALDALQYMLSQKVQIQNPELIAILEQRVKEPAEYLPRHADEPVEVDNESRIPRVLEALKAQQRDLLKAK